jgi:hypothetical protein
MDTEYSLDGNFKSSIEKSDIAYSLNVHKKTSEMLCLGNR